MKPHKISWLNVPGYTPQTWNPIVGCSKISEGCRNCYAERDAAAGRLQQFDRYRDVVTDGQWNGKTILHEETLRKPLQWSKPRAIFVGSMTDLLHENTPDEWIDQVHYVMAKCPQHLFIVLTKRAERMAQYYAVQRDLYETNCGDYKPKASWPLPNVWLGVTAENQAAADQRIPHLLRTPAAVRFVSCEPLLGPVDLSASLVNSQTIHLKMSISGAIQNRAFGGFEENGIPVSRKQVERMLLERLSAGEKYFPMCDCKDFDPQTGCPPKKHPRLDWIICGGESGPQARPMDSAWARSLRDQAHSAGVPFFFKQWGDNMCRHNVPPYYSKKQKHGGDTLDGRQHHNFPKGAF